MMKETKLSHNFETQSHYQINRVTILNYFEMNSCIKHMQRTFQYHYYLRRIRHTMLCMHGFWQCIIYCSNYFVRYTSENTNFLIMLDSLIDGYYF